MNQGEKRKFYQKERRSLSQYRWTTVTNAKVLQTETTPAQDRMIGVEANKAPVEQKHHQLWLFLSMFTRETEKLAPVVTDNSSAKDEKAPVTATIKEDKERLLPATGEQEATASSSWQPLLLSCLLVFQKNFKD